MSTVSITKVVRINPAVIAAGGSNITLSGLLLTTSWRVPVGTVRQFSSTQAVQDFFGGATVEANAAAKYFSGFTNSNKKPGKLLFSQYNLVNVGAYLRGGNISAMSLTQLQGISGTLSIVLDGVTKSGSPNLSGVTSFTNAAQLIADTLSLAGPQSASFTGTISSTTLTASAVTGAIDIGGVIAGSGVTAGTYVVQQLTGTPGGAGTYQVSDSQTVGSIAMTGKLAGMTYDSVSGAFKVISPTTGVNSTAAFATGAISGSLKLTSVTGAVLSQGAAAQTDPATYMNNLIQITRAFAPWGLTFNPDQPGENDVRFAFAEWNGDQNGRFAFVAIDEDEAPATTLPAPDSLAQRIKAAQIGGTISNWQLPPDDPNDYANVVAFVCGYFASIDFTQTNGRVTLDFRRQSGMNISVSDDTTYDNLVGNGYNFFEVSAEGEGEWRWYTTGQISGDFLWADSYANQMGLNLGFTRDLANLLQNAFSIPYNAAGRATIQTALADRIQQFLNFGAYRAGVALSESQKADVNARAGKNIADTIVNQGWYLDVGVASPEVRQQRGSPPMSFYYADGQTVQRFDMDSIALL